MYSIEKSVQEVIYPHSLFNAATYLILKNQHPFTVCWYIYSSLIGHEKKWREKLVSDKTIKNSVEIKTDMVLQIT